MSEQDRKGTKSRRQFFRQVALGAGAVGAVASGLGSAPAAEAKVADNGSRYRESEHVKTYYDLSKAF